MTAVLTAPLGAQPVSPLMLADLLRGQCVRLLKWSWRRAEVLAALVSHANSEHDIVWPGIDTLAEEAGVSPSTVKRALADIRHELGVRVIWGAEKHEGPGQHRYKKATRSKKKIAVNHYDLSPLAQLVAPVAEALHALLAAGMREVRSARRAAKPGQPKHALAGLAGAEAKANPDSPSPVAECTMRRSAEEYSGPDTDPFAPADSELTFKAQSGLTPAVCNVAINSAEGKAEGPGATRSVARTTRSGSTSPAPAGPPVQAPATQVAPGSDVLKVKNGLLKYEKRDLPRPGQAMLRRIGMSKHVARQIVAGPPAQYRERGELFAVLLASYAKQSEVRGLVHKDKASYAYGVWKGYEDDGWPEWFHPTLRAYEDREREAYPEEKCEQATYTLNNPEKAPVEHFVERENEKPAKNIPSVTARDTLKPERTTSSPVYQGRPAEKPTGRPSSAPTPSLPSSPPVPLPSPLSTRSEERRTEEILADLSPEERADLEKRAVAVVAARCPAGSKVQDRVKAEGLGHPGVQAEALRILLGS